MELGNSVERFCGGIVNCEPGAAISECGLLREVGGS